MEGMYKMYNDFFENSVVGLAAAICLAGVFDKLVRLTLCVLAAVFLLRFSQSCWRRTKGLADPVFVKVAVECVSMTGTQPVGVSVGRSFRTAAGNRARREL